MLLTLSLFWGGSFYYIEIALRSFPPLTLVFFRVAIAAATLWSIIFVLKYRVVLSWPLAKAFLIMGLLNNIIPFTLISWGQTTISSGLASILNASTPLFAVVIAGVFLSDERMTRQKVLGTFVGFVGVSIMLGVSMTDLSSGTLLAKLAILGAGVSYSCAGVFGRKFQKIRVNAVVAAAGQVTASTLLLLPLVVIVEQPWQLPFPSTESVVAMLALSIVSTAIAYILYFRISASAGATNILRLVTFLVPVSAVLRVGYL